MMVVFGRKRAEYKSPQTDRSEMAADSVDLISFFCLIFEKVPSRLLRGLLRGYSFYYVVLTLTSGARAF